MRNESVTIAKAIAIMLMVLAHTYFSDYGNKWINMFHMPLFFFFAGYCFKDKYLAAPKSFVERRIHGLYIPFVKWSLIFLLLHNVFYDLNIYNGEHGFRGITSQIYDWKDFAKKSIAIVTRMSENEQLLGGYWFLKSLLCGSLIAYGTIKYVNNTKIGGGILLVLTIALSATRLHVPYFNIGATETFAALFFVSGYIYHESGITWHKTIWIIPIGIISVTIGKHYWQASLLNFEWWMVPCYFLTAIGGLMAVYSVSAQIEKGNNKIRSLLIFIGNNTLTILTWHFLCFKLVSWLIICLYGLPIVRLAEFPVIQEYSSQGWFVAYFIVGVIIPLYTSKYRFFR